MKKMRWLWLLLGMAALLVGLFFGMRILLGLPRALASSELPPLEDVKPTSKNHAPIAPADGFDFPVGPPDAKKYYNAQGFQKNDHLGEDWNGVGGGNTDKGDPVYAVAGGRVAIAEDFGPGWGNVIRILHNIGTTENPILIESLYAHLDQMQVRPDETIRRGQQIGTIGDADGAYWAHLHLEMRWRTGLPLGGGYSMDTTGFLAPTPFIRAHRSMDNEQ